MNQECKRCESINPHRYVHLHGGIFKMETSDYQYGDSLELIKETCTEVAMNRVNMITF